MSKKIIGVTVGTPISVSKIANELNPATEGYVEEKILDLVQGRRVVRYADDAERALQAEFAVKAERDAKNQVIHETYTSKSEFNDHRQDLEEGRFVVRDAQNAEKAEFADKALWADNASIAYRDMFNNPIHETYATKGEVGDINTALDSILAIQNTLIGGDA